ncbi:hypothetical protein ACWGI8_21495 [Streptomyces sp. NPDC054841]
MTKRVGRIVCALALAAGALTGCTAAGQAAEAGEAGKAGKGEAVETVRARPSGRAIPYDLYTHCGIDEARIGSTYFEAQTPLDDGAGNPPEGWDNPTQRGTMTLTSGTQAVFTDDAGHEVTFRARPGATGFKRICA